MKFGNWIVKDIVGSGGNGKVYKVTQNNEDYFALKSLKTKSTKSYKRFRDEIIALNNLKGINGVIDIIDYHLPEDPTNSEPYYLMPLGISIEVFLRDKSPLTLFNIFTQLTQSLIEIHDRDYTHRDIKPNNILIIEGKPFFSDFGLVSFPSKEKLTKSDESVGARWTIAPEMQRNSTTAEYKKADVYSMAKTLWMLITRDPKGFEGQYQSNSIMSISHNKVLKKNNALFSDWNFSSTILLEKLLTSSTDNNPIKRPAIKKFHEELIYWLETSNQFKESNHFEWEETIQNLFPYSIPKYCEWNDYDSIYNVLQVLTKFESLNHCFLPVSGGIDFQTVRKNRRIKELMINESYAFYPLSLKFYSLGTSQWCFFRLELSTLTPLSTEINHERKYEYLYLDKSDRYIFKEKNKSIRILRYLSGSIMIVQKTSYFNSLRGELDGYFALHETMSAEIYLSKWAKIKEVIETMPIKQTEIND